MIEVRGLRFAYPKASAETLRGLDFAVAPGEIFGLLGPSGAGKSTTQKILMGSLRGYGGSARVEGREARGADPSYRARIGVAFEFPSFYQKLTGLENLRLFASLYPGEQEDPAALMERLGLGEARDRRVAAYSKGMRMRLNLARALVHRPRVLFLDEPTGGLDPVNAKIARDLVAERARAGAAVFISTHDMATAEALCDRVAFLVDGAILACDSPEALRRRHGRRAVELRREEDGGLVSEEFPLDGLAANRAFLEALASPGLLGLRTLDASLDSIFIELTGRELS